jgi:arabinose-5-phosphate isomerase
MDLTAHALPESLIYQLVTGDAALACELLGHDTRLEMSVVVRLHPNIGSGQTGADQPRNLLWAHPSDIITPFMSSAAIPADTSSLLATARRALAIEARAVEALLARLDDRFADACRVCLQCQGRIVVTGMGKSGHIAHKVAATLASTGSPAFFLHPAEASHGDLGMITRGDAVLALSNSGETPELLLLLPHLKRLAVPLIVMAGKTDSTLGRAATVAIDVSVPEEACPLNLAPTASTTATLAMGDALAVAVLEARGFTKQDFARSHPGGSLGRQLLLHVEQLMRTGEALPRVGPKTRLGDGLVEMSRKGLGMTVIVDDGNRILGVFTDGDLRRALDRQVDVHGAVMSEVMTSPCRSMGPQDLAAEAVHLMEVHRITALPVADEQGRLIGALNVHDLLRAGVM